MCCFLEVHGSCSMGLMRIPLWKHHDIDSKVSKGSVSFTKVFMPGILISVLTPDIPLTMVSSRHKEMLALLPQMLGVRCTICHHWHHDALLFTLATHPDRSISLTDLALVLLQSSWRTLDQKPLHEAVQHLREVLDLCPIGHPHRLGALRNLAAALSLQTHLPRGSGDSSTGDIDPDEIMGLHREALWLMHAGHIDYLMMLQHFVGEQPAQYIVH